MQEFLEAVKGEVVPDTVYVFTPDGDIKELPIDSTPVDFAYSIHSAVGDKCVGAKVNGRMVPLRYKLVSGDVVEIVTSPNQTPSKDWLKFVVTQRAKSKIRQWARAEERTKGIELGTRLLEDELRRHGLPISATLKSEKMDEVIKAYSLQSLDDLLVQIGYGKISAHQIVNRFMPERGHEDAQQAPRPAKPVREQKTGAIRITGIDNVLYRLGKCCMPVPGDKVIGFITRGKGVTIHRTDCKNVERNVEPDGRYIDVDWIEESEGTSTTRIFIEAVDKPGMLANLSIFISAENVNISSVKAHSTHDRRAFIELTLEVKNQSQLLNIMNKIRQLDGIFMVRR